MLDGDYGTPTVEYYPVRNNFNQTFVDAVHPLIMQSYKHEHRSHVCIRDVADGFGCGPDDDACREFMSRAAFSLVSHKLLALP